MLDAVVGAVIMVIATTSLLSAVEVIEKAFADAGRQNCLSVNITSLSATETTATGG